MIYLLYIPIWLYSNPANPRNWVPANPLYIPIWLYSNYLISCIEFLNHTLYIPIWLYSNSLRSCCLLCLFRLYIPIWLYSNVDCDKVAIENPVFTFQSGYIQICKHGQERRFRMTLYIPIWLYSNPYPIIPSIQAILNTIFVYPYIYKYKTIMDGRVYNY